MERNNFEALPQKPKTVMKRIEEMALGMIQRQKPEYVKKYSKDIDEIIKDKEAELKSAWERELLEGRGYLDPEKDEEIKARLLAVLIEDILDKKYHN